MQSAAGTGLQMELNFGGLEKGVKLKDLAIMSRQMATMVAAGLALLKALTILSEQTENKKLARTLGIVRTQVETGSSLSEALAKHPAVFPPLMVHLVKAGEVGGFLEQSLESVADTFEKDVKLHGDDQVGDDVPDRRARAWRSSPSSAWSSSSFRCSRGMFDDLGGELPIPTQILVVAVGERRTGCCRSSSWSASSSRSGGARTSTPTRCASSSIRSS